MPILQWRGLGVTDKLANAQSSKIILIPAGSDQPPIILDSGGNWIGGTLYIVLCLLLFVIAGVIGSHRTFGLRGYPLLSVLATPLASFIVLAMGANRKQASIE